jgi:isopentenyl phosphate kinase
VAAAKYGTRDGVFSPEGWGGFSEVAAAAARLNRLVESAMIAAGVPALTVAPSATAQCQEGRLAQMETTALNQALDAGLVPVVYGDVAFDTVRGGTIVSTEEVLSFLASHLQPTWLLLAGEVPGVLDADGQVAPLIRPDNFETIAPALGGSRGTDVTGGMAAKVGDMLALVQAHPGLRVRIFSGLEEGLLGRLLSQPDSAAGTLIIAG